MSSRHGATADSRYERLAEPFAEQGDDLPDLDDLFGRGQNERRETFPRLLPQHAQSAARGHGIAHRRVVGKSFEHGGQIRFGLQIIAQPLPVGDRPGGFGANAVARLCQAHPMLADDADPGIVAGSASGRPGRSPASRPDRNRGRAKEFRLPAFVPTLRTGRRGRRGISGPSRPSAFGISSHFAPRISHFKL